MNPKLRIITQTLSKNTTSPTNDQTYVTISRQMLLSPNLQFIDTTENTVHKM